MRVNLNGDWGLAARGVVFDPMKAIDRAFTTPGSGNPAAYAAADSIIGGFGLQDAAASVGYRIPGRNNPAAAAAPATPVIPAPQPVPAPDQPATPAPGSPTATPVAEMPSTSSTPVNAAAAKTVAAISNRSGRRSTVLTSTVRRPTAAAATAASPAGGTIAGSDIYSRRTLG